ncbi:MAG: serine/threonine protein kinase [Chloracidobacterium sp.]|nr:serine/threonine protein kinase [Chloracidobacterium sp.]
MEDPTKLDSSGNENKTEIKSNTTADTKTGEFVAGTVLASRYRIIGLVGKGGMGEVYKAEDIKLSQMVALKFLPDSYQNDTAALERFHGEVRNARQVSHVNVCRVFDIGEIDGRHFLSMEFVDGDDLSALLTRVGRFTSERAVEIARQLCVGMEAIHKAGILHRDFKPGNIIIDSKGVARITDFGIAGVEAEMKGDNIRAGTPAYMSPEQVTGKGVTVRSDIYALGLVIYEIFTGKQAFIADNVMELIKMQQTATPTNASEIVNGIDPLVESVIAQCLEKDPKNRPQSALQVAMALPGGNPMQIALDAGQTPSPEMIAATPVRGALKPLVALLCLLGVIASLISMVVINGRYKTFNLTPLQKSPEALADRAETMVKTFGYGDKPADKRHNYQSKWDFLNYAKENKWTDTADRLRTGQPYEIYFLYRQSPRLLTNYVRNEPGIAENNPPFDVPGMINVSLDTTGRLIEFRAIPPENTANLAESPKADWTKLFTEAGLDINKFETVAPEWTPPVFSDDRMAWKGTLADWTDIPIRIEAAAFQGKPVYFRIVPPWQKSLAAQPAPTWTVIDLIGLVVILLAFVSSIFLVWRNVRSGRADLRGTGKIALAFFVFNLIFQLTTPSLHFADVGAEVWVAIDAIQASLFIGILSGTFYCAVEPFVRRWWSEIFISWSRLLAGDFRDPMVGRDILVGALLGLVANLLFDKLGLLVTEWQLGIQVVDASYHGINNALTALAGFPGAAFVYSSLNALLILTLLVVFYFVFRNRKAAIAVLCVFLVMLNVNDLPYQLGLLFVLILVKNILQLVSLVRFGLLAMIACLIFPDIGSGHAMTFDTSSILFPNAIVQLTLLIGIATYAAYISVGGAKMFGGKSFMGD